jgi:hypothetical protein
VLIEKCFNATTIGNAVFGGVIGVGVDAVSGATNELKPKKPHLILVRLSQGQPTDTVMWYSEDQFKRKEEVDTKCGKVEQTDKADDTKSS